MANAYLIIRSLSVFLSIVLVLSRKDVPDHIMKNFKGNPDVANLIKLYKIQDRGRNFEDKAVALPNEPCKPRLTVVPIPQPASVTSFYYPYYVQAHRCAGGCGPLEFLSQCRPKETNTVLAKAVQITWSSGQNEVPPALAYVEVVNHTSCECNCNNDGEACNRFQYWDTNICKCSCQGWGCPGNFTPHPNSCCSCEIKEKECVGRKKVWNSDHCACICKNLKKPCKNSMKMRDPNTCKCICPPIICRSGSKMNSKSCVCEPHITNML